MQDIPTKINGVSTLPAEEFNQIPTELENLISTGGIALSGADLFQCARAVSTIASQASAYIDSGTANAKVLTVTGARANPVQYSNGMLIAFINQVQNTGAVTINVSGLGLKELTNQTGGSLQGGFLQVGDTVLARYDGTVFTIIGHKPYSEVRDLIARSRVLAYNGSASTQLAEAVIELVGSADYYTDIGTGNTYTLSNPYGQAGGYLNGLRVRFKATHTNTGASTIHIPYFGSPKSIITPDGNAITEGVIQSGRNYEFIYDGTSFVVVGCSDTQWSPLRVEGTPADGTQVVPSAVFTEVKYLGTRSAASTTTWINGTNGRFFPTEPGRYYISGYVELANFTSASAILRATIAVNGVATFYSSVYAPTSATLAPRGVDVQGFVNVGPGDYVSILAYQDSGSDQTISVANMFAFKLR